MSGLLTRWVIMTVAVLIAASIIPGFQIDSPLIAFLAAVVLSLLISFVRPILILMTLPINVMTLGLFVLVINGVLIFIAAGVISGFQVMNFGAAFLGALVISLVSTLLNMMIGDRKEKQ